MSSCHKSKRICRDVEYEVCDRSIRKVPAILVCKVFAPVFEKDCDFGDLDLYDNEKLKELCHKFKYELCSQSKQIVPAIVKCKTLAPRFKNKKDCEYDGSRKDYA